MNKIIILEEDRNKRGDLFGRAMQDFFHALGYSDFRLEISKTGREIDIEAIHRKENRKIIAECKAHKERIGGADINKFVGVLDAEKRRHKEQYIQGYFISLSGYRESAIEQERELGGDRVLLIESSDIILELQKGKIITPIEIACEKAGRLNTNDELELLKDFDILLTTLGWIWVIKFKHKVNHENYFCLIHADGEPLSKTNIEGESLLFEDYFNAEGVDWNFLGKKSIEEEYFDDKEIKSKYLEYIVREYGIIEFEGLPTDQEIGSKKIALEDIFVPLFLNNYDKDEKTSFPFYNSNYGNKNIEISSILKLGSKIAILGTPGSGKSTLIKRLAVAYTSKENLEKSSDNLPDYNWFPIVIRCRDIDFGTSLSIENVVYSIPVKAEMSYLEESFKKLFQQNVKAGRILLLIDGLDEIPDRKQKIIFSKQLRTFLGTYPNITLVITSRETGFRIVGRTISSYCEPYLISELNDRQILFLIKHWHEKVIQSNTTQKENFELLNLLKSTSKIYALAKNPLLLTTILLVRRSRGFIPSKKSILYQEVIRVLLLTWNVEGHEPLDLDEAEPQLCFLAFEMMKRGSQIINYKDLKNILASARRELPEFLGFTQLNISEFIERVEERSSILILSGYEEVDGEILPVYEFLHLVFQEFLSAKAFVEQYYPKAEENGNLLENIKPFLPKENWKEVIPLITVLLGRKAKEIIFYLMSLVNNIEKSHDQDNFYESLYEIYYPYHLLCSCVINEIKVTPETIKDILELVIAKSEEDLINEYHIDIKNSKYKTIYEELLNSNILENNKFLLKNRKFVFETVSEELKFDNEPIEKIISFANKNLFKEEGAEKEKIFAYLVLIQVFKTGQINPQIKFNLNEIITKTLDKIQDGEIQSIIAFVIMLSEINYFEWLFLENDVNLRKKVVNSVFTLWFKSEEKLYKILLLKILESVPVYYPRKHIIIEKSILKQLIKDAKKIYKLYEPHEEKSEVIIPFLFLSFYAKSFFTEKEIIIELESFGISNLINPISTDLGSEDENWGLLSPTNYSNLKLLRAAIEKDYYSSLFW